MKLRILSVLLTSIGSYAVGQSPYFHNENSTKPINRVENRSDQSIFLTIPGNLDLSVYGRIRVKIFGTKHQARLSEPYQIIDIPSTHVQNKINDGLSYSFIFLKNIDRNIWISDLGIQDVGVMRYNYVRAEVWGLTIEDVAAYSP